MLDKPQIVTTSAKIGSRPVAASVRASQTTSVANSTSQAKALSARRHFHQLIMPALPSRELGFDQRG